MADQLLYEDTDKKIYLVDPGEFDEETGEVITPRVERVEYSRPRTDRLYKAPRVLRQWADQADKVTVTQGNAINVLQGVVDNLSQFYSHFADFIEDQYGSE